MTGGKEEFLGQIFALYAIIRSTSRNLSGKKRMQSIKFRPHEVQVTTIFLLLGIIKDNEEKLASRMTEVGTGEGKSIVLAITAAYLVLVGFDVRIACYSQYLSERDQINFIDFFFHSWGCYESNRFSKSTERNLIILLI